MMNPDHPDLIREAEMRRKAQGIIPQCPSCGIWPILKYEPGILQASCKCQTWATDEEDRMSLANRIARDLEKKIRRTD
jgi:hypothetical protein